VRQKLSTFDQKNRIQATFNGRSSSWQAGYSEARDFRNYNFLIRRTYVLELLLHEVTAGRFLDLGCGTGDYLPALFERNLDVWCVDVSPAMLAGVRERFSVTSSKLHISEGDIEKMDYPDEFFDGIICAGVLEYLTEDSKALLEIKRILKKGGTAVITVPNKISIFMMLDSSVYWSSRFIGFIFDKLHIFKFIFRRERLNRTSIHNYYVPSRFITRLDGFGFSLADFSYCSFGSFILSSIFPFSINFSQFCERFRRNNILGPFALNYIVKVVKK